ncbi:MAG TPA: hypothetical protein VJL28_06465 [Gemmatimonadaceae bacterium]|nr:hypothetical protein [Gemmatimonadaceae bacterium]
MRLLQAVIVSPAFVFAACYGGEKAASSSSPADAGTPAVVTFHAKDFAFEGPAEVTAGLTTIKLVNDGPGFHHLQLVRLDSGKTVADLLTAMKNPGPPPAWAAFVTGPNAPDPGHESNATLDLAAGSYAMICLVDVPDGVPHFAKGMASALMVKPAAVVASAAAPPAADVVVTLRDYAFTLSKPLAAGKQTVEVHTEAAQPHEIEIIKLAAGKTADDMLKWMMKPDGPPPGSGIGGVAATVQGVNVRFDADLTPGDYLLICFIPDAKDGKPHFTKGMMQVVKVS